MLPALPISRSPTRNRKYPLARPSPRRTGQARAEGVGTRRRQHQDRHRRRRLSGTGSRTLTEAAPAAEGPRWHWSQEWVNTNTEYAPLPPLSLRWNPSQHGTLIIPYTFIGQSGTQNIYMLSAGARVKVSELSTLPRAINCPVVLYLSLFFFLTV